jgi:hypothetical protein
MFKKAILVLTAFIIGLALFGCNKTPDYKDVQVVYQDLVKVHMIADTKLSAATNGQEAAVALKELEAANAKINPILEELTKKYPEIKNEANIPAPLKNDLDQLKNSMVKFQQTMINVITKYGNDPEFKKLLTR